MEQNISTVAGIVLKYDALLQRYAQFLTRSSDAAPLIVQRAIEDYYTQSKKQCPGGNRQALRSCTLVACRQWMQLQIKDREQNRNLLNQQLQQSGTTVLNPLTFNPQLHLLQTLFAKKPKNPV